MTPYRDPTVPRSTTVARSPTETRRLMAAMAILALASAGLAVVAAFGEIEDPFIAGLGSVLCGCSAAGVLLGKVMKGSGSAACPACKAKIDDVERTGHVEGILCAQCGIFLRSDEGELRPMDLNTIAERPIFGASLADGFTWPAGCVVCGGAVTQALPAGVLESDTSRDLGINVMGLAMAATIGVGFWVDNGKRVRLDVPHCGEHDDGAILTRTGSNKYMLLFRSYPYQRAFCELNRALPIESPETGRSAERKSRATAANRRAREPVGTRDAAARRAWREGPGAAATERPRSSRAGRIERRRRRGGLMTVTPLRAGPMNRHAGPSAPWRALPLAARDLLW